MTEALNRLTSWVARVGEADAVALLAKSINPATGLPFGRRRATRVVRAAKKKRKVTDPTVGGDHFEPDEDDLGGSSDGDGYKSATVVGLLAPFLKGKVQNPGARGGQFHYAKTSGSVEYGAEGPGRQPAAPKAATTMRTRAAMPGGPDRGERRRQAKAAAGKATAQPMRTPPGAQHVQAFKSAYETIRSVALGLLQGARNFATDSKLRLMHAALTAQKTWQGFEHHVKKYGGDAEELVTHALIEVPELVEHVMHLAHSVGHAAAHAVAHHGPELLQAGMQAMDMLGKSTTWRRIAKSDQLKLFGGNQLRLGDDVKNPGVRGGKYYRTKQGAVRYGEQPAAGYKPGQRVQLHERIGGGTGTVIGPADVPADHPSRKGPQLAGTFHPDVYNGRVLVEQENGTRFACRPENLSPLAGRPAIEPAGEKHEGQTYRPIKKRSGRYDIKCDDCKEKMGETDSLRVSAEGGRCPRCKGGKQ